MMGDSGEVVKPNMTGDSSSCVGYAVLKCTKESLLSKLIISVTTHLMLNIQNISQQDSDSLDCGVFVDAYAAILSEGQQVHSCDFDIGSQCARYASLLWNYGVIKEEKGYTSDNNDPPRPRNSYLQSPDESAIVTLR
ncbi:hypothetical protein CQW23_23455 [Capsicum baccatum]|uniref:Ubiquitin-like protease family profile domain-containing protein n=1 Tax=Capsicum baccatum TaxID=33114 RepID=A0A2G2VS09_CAPBA|nr:hypothetical protein CQW23_23455 [Capsicum baccatum]